MSDSAAFHEIDDAIRQDDLRAFWKRYGTWIVAAVVVVVVAIAALVGWQRYRESERAVASAAYSAALAQIGHDDAAARSALEQQAKSAVEPYRSLAALTAAQLQAKPEDQVVALLAIAPKLPGEFGDLARVIAGFRSIDTTKGAETVAK
ncbi:MAG TPA: tetratricopeptide repeat protein, partial [Gammaproteobacteria bacterium]|nr:tetratricopeptide repeat protein [Gammaproteobacteria bacterium]